MNHAPMRTAEAYRRGITRGQLRARRWHRLHRGVVTTEASDPADPWTSIQAATALMTPNSVLTGWAAAFVQGVRFAASVRPRETPVVIASPDGGQHRHRDGIKATRRYIRLDEREEFDGIAVATIARAAYDMALDARSLTDAVAAFDMCTSTVIDQARTTPGNLSRLVDRHRKTHGISRAREALALTSSRSASPWESRTRMLCVRGVGLENLLVNSPVFDAGGDLLGVVDLLDPTTGLAIESDGDHHREAETHTDDNHREERLERAGLVVCRVTSLDHRERQRTIARIHHARRDAARSTRHDWTLDKPSWWWTWPQGRRWD